VYVDASDDDRNFPEEVRSKYIITRELGAGAFGRVYLVFEKVCTSIEKQQGVLMYFGNGNHT
jgi:hypothetical protein